MDAAKNHEELKLAALDQVVGGSMFKVTSLLWHSSSRPAAESKGMRLPMSNALKILMHL